MARIAIKAHPRARRSGVAGKMGDAWKIDVATPAVEGKANDECVRLLAELAGVRRAAVRIVVGGTSRAKVVEVDGVEQAALEAVLEKARRSRS